MGGRNIDFVVVFVLNAIHRVVSDGFLSCDPYVLNPCPDNKQICNQTTLQCECDDGLVIVGNMCESPSQASGQAATAAIAVILTVVLLIGAIVLVVRKYNIVELVREKLRSRNNVVYEDVMIGQDDPPLSM